MNHPHDTAIFTTLSAIAGGLGKALAIKPVLLSITAASMASVVAYAAASAAAGYVVKRVMDQVADRFFSKNSNSAQKGGENE